MADLAVSDDLQASQQALLELERSKIPPVELLHEVAQILGVKYDSLRSTYLDQSRDRKGVTPLTEFSPKEEWVLRWLLKRTGLSSSGGKRKISSHDASCMSQDKRSWLLLLHLFHKVPSKTLARILSENDFVSNLDVSLQGIITSQGKTDGEEAKAQEVGVSSGISQRGKKRKRASLVNLEPESSINEPQQVAGDSIIEMICAAVECCVGFTEGHDDQVLSELMRLALAVPPQKAASLVGQLFSSVELMVSECLSGSFAEALLKSLLSVLRVWDYRVGNAADNLREVSDEAFTSTCLNPCLALLQLLVASPSGLTKHVERLIALHSVLPARSRFFQNGPGAIGSVFGMNLKSTSNSALLFDISIRSAVRNTFRRRQHEQPWLDALFTTLSENGGLEDLLQVAINRGVTLSMDSLSAMVKHELDSPDPWAILAKVAQLDAKVFLTSPLLDLVCNKISHSQNTGNIIRDGIIIPVMNAAGSTRDLPSFVNIWQTWLKKAICPRPDDWEDKLGLSVWWSEQLFLAFTDLARTALTPAYVRSFLRDFLNHVTEIFTEATLAWLAIIDCIMLSRVSDCIAEAGILRKLLEVVSANLKRKKIKEQWRLWRTARRILSILPDTGEPAGLLTPTGPGSHLAHVSLESQDPIPDRVECFHFLVSRALIRPSSHQELMQREVDKLASKCSNFSTAESGLADACVGILLQNTEVLLVSSLETLWLAVWQRATDQRENSTFQRLFEALVTSETVTSNSALLSQAFKAIHDSIVNKGHRSRYAYKMLQSIPFKNIKKSREQASAVKILEAVGIPSVEERQQLVPAASLPKLNNETCEAIKQYKSLIASNNILESGIPLTLFPPSSGISGTFEHFCLRLDYTKLTLNRNASTVNQWAADHLLSELALLTSAHSPIPSSSMPANGPAAIYQRLCNLTGTLLSRFRKRLGGRYHLLLPVIQGLLRSLFQPIPVPTSAKQSQIRRVQAPWLYTSKHSKTTVEPLGAKSATQFTRLLTSLCDPTASAVKSSSKHRSGSASDLVDETKKAKSISGQYMQYVVMEYTKYQLQGQISPEVKAALMPGLYAILDVMSRDLMRAMNAQMDGSGRAIFKGVYDDWVRFGRWNQN